MLNDIALLNKSSHPALTPARQDGTRFTYSGGMEGWVELGYWLHAEMITEQERKMRRARREACVVASRHFFAHFKHCDQQYTNSTKWN